MRLDKKCSGEGNTHLPTTTVVGDMLQPKMLLPTTVIIKLDSKIH